MTSKCEVCGCEHGKRGVVVDYFLGVIAFCRTNKECTHRARQLYNLYREGKLDRASMTVV